MTTRPKEGEPVGTPVEVTHKTEPAVTIAADELWALVGIALDTLKIHGGGFSIGNKNRKLLVQRIVNDNWDAAPFNVIGRFELPKKGGSW